MSQETKKIKELFEREEKVRKFVKEKGQSNEDFSYANFFAGDEFNKELDKIKTEESTEFKINLIDLDQMGKEGSE